VIKPNESNNDSLSGQDERGVQADTWLNIEVSYHFSLLKLLQFNLQYCVSVTFICEIAIQCEERY
jgi:hypothetical protein